MTTFRAEILADSINRATHSRLTTMRLTYPRPIHPEFMTHRMFARCAASSRAIPSKRMRANIRRDMFVPLAWGENKPGMQAGKEIAAWRKFLGRLVWIALGHIALFASAFFDKLGVHKQIVNRITEPWSHITVVVTGTDEAFAQFYDLRRHPAAEPHIHMLADEMARAHRESIPRALNPGEWHLPYVTDGESVQAIAKAIDYMLENAGVDVEAFKKNANRTGWKPPSSIVELVRRSVARVARVSYNKPDTGTPSTLEEDLALHDRLVGSTPMHASPAEHQAQAAESFEARGLSGCFGPSSGWIQYRKTLKGEMTSRSLSETIQP